MHSSFQVDVLAAPSSPLLSVLFTSLSMWILLCRLPDGLPLPFFCSLYLPTHVHSSVQVDVLASIPMVSLSAGARISMSVDTAGHVWAWGDASNGDPEMGGVNPSCAPCRFPTELKLRI